MDGACAALRQSAAEMRIVQADVVTQGVEQRHVGISFNRMILAVDVKREFLSHGILLPGRACRSVADVRCVFWQTFLSSSLCQEADQGKGLKHKSDVSSPAFLRCALLGPLRHRDGVARARFTPECDNVRATGTSAMGHVWTAPWQELSDVATALVGCGHVSGLFVRRIWPLALMLCADRVPIESTHFKVR